MVTKRSWGFIVAGAILTGAALVGVAIFVTNGIGTTPNPPPAPVAIAAPMPSSALEEASKDSPWENSLGMKFVPVAGTKVFFSIWDTRVQDFKAFVDGANYDATRGMYSLCKEGLKRQGANWKSPGFEQGPLHPVVGVSWNDAQAFCDWLAKKEHANGRLPKDRVYRLPTDAEWSVAVGLRESGATPRTKVIQGADRYAWGKQFPPPAGAGNFAGEEAKVGDLPSDLPVITGYNDGWPRTSPVGAFAPNQFGLFDMAGNVWQWCEDWFEPAVKDARVLRGSSWYIGNPGSMWASYRVSDSPDKRSDGFGFRCVVAMPESTE